MKVLSQALVRRKTATIATAFKQWIFLFDPKSTAFDATLSAIPPYCSTFQGRTNMEQKKGKRQQ